MSFKNIVLCVNTSRILQFYRRKHRDSDVVVLVTIYCQLKIFALNAIVRLLSK